MLTPTAELNVVQGRSRQTCHTFCSTLQGQLWLCSNLMRAVEPAGIQMCVGGMQYKGTASVSAAGLNTMPRQAPRYVKKPWPGSCWCLMSERRLASPSTGWAWVQTEQHAESRVILV